VEALCSLKPVLQLFFFIVMLFVVAWNFSSSKVDIQNLDKVLSF